VLRRTAKWRPGIGFSVPETPEIGRPMLTRDLTRAGCPIFIKDLDVRWFAFQSFCALCVSAFNSLLFVEKQQRGVRRVEWRSVLRFGFSFRGPEIQPEEVQVCELGSGGGK
jgi:hypothetical protein